MIIYDPSLQIPKKYKNTTTKNPKEISRKSKNLCFFCLAARLQNWHTMAELEDLQQNAKRRTLETRFRFALATLATHVALLGSYHRYRPLPSFDDLEAVIATVGI